MKRTGVHLNEPIARSPVKQRVTLECRVCGAPASGFNFDQISCESCKAFFRRNALRQMPSVSCRFSSSCSITVESRRQCTSCRLKKCFDVKMRKEWIQTEEERQLRELRRFCKQENTRQPFEGKKEHTKRAVVPWPISTHRFLSNLNVEDYSVINNINHSYDQWALQCDTEHIKYYSLERTSLVHFLNDEQQMFRSLIDFYKQVPEFRRIPIDDQVLLIKCNLTHLVHVHHVLKDQFTENTHIGRLMSRWISPSFHNQMSRARRTYDYFLKHPMILKLSLVVLIFTVNLSRLPDEDLHNELLARRSLGNCQELYVTLLWNYLNAIFDERGAVQSMGLLVFQYLRYQRLMNEMDLFIVEHFHPAQFHPLTKSAFRLP